MKTARTWTDHQAFVDSGAAPAAKLRLERAVRAARAEYERDISIGFFLEIESIAKRLPEDTCYFQYTTMGQDGVALMIACPGLEKISARRMTQAHATQAREPERSVLLAMARDGAMQDLAEAAYDAFELLCYEAPSVVGAIREAVHSAAIACGDAVRLARASGCEEAASLLEAARLASSTGETGPARAKPRL